MGEEEEPIYTTKEINLFKVMHRYDLSLKMTKFCSRICGLMQINKQNSLLNDKEKSCIENCGGNISKSYDFFFNKCKDNYKIQEGDGEGEEGEAEDDE